MARSDPGEASRFYPALADEVLEVRRGISNLVQAMESGGNGGRKCESGNVEDLIKRLDLHEDDEEDFVWEE